MKSGRLKNKFIWIFLEMFFIIITVSFHILKYYSLRDYFIIVLIVTMGETVYRQFHGWIHNGKKIYFIMKLREENLIKLLKRARQRTDIEEEINHLIRLTENSLSLLGVLSAISLTLVILAISLPQNGIEPTSTNLKIFALSGFITFVLFIADLGLCYSLLEPSMRDIPEIIINGMRRYYYLIMLGLIMFAITFMWGVYTYTEFFHPELLIEKLSIIIFLVMLFILYDVVYLYRVEQPS